MSEDFCFPERVLANDRPSGWPPTDRSLIAAVRSGTLDQRKAAARLVPVPPHVAEVLVESGEPQAVAALLANRAAVLSEESLHKCLDRLAHDEAVQMAMIRRDRLPPGIVLRLLALTSGRLSTELLARHAAPPLPEGERGELGPDRPGWWSQHIKGLLR